MRSGNGDRANRLSLHVTVRQRQLERPMCNPAGPTRGASARGCRGSACRRARDASAGHSLADAGADPGCRTGPSRHLIARNTLAQLPSVALLFQQIGAGRRTQQHRDSRIWSGSARAPAYAVAAGWPAPRPRRCHADTEAAELRSRTPALVPLIRPANNMVCTTGTITVLTSSYPRPAPAASSDCCWRSTMLEKYPHFSSHHVLLGGGQCTLLQVLDSGRRSAPRRCLAITAVVP
jgi:hypothetical protein